MLRRRSTAAALLLVLLPACTTATVEPASPPRPNVIVVLVDDLGWADLACSGSDYYATPHIDRLAAGGLRFTHAYAAAAVCSPTRAALLTGRYPARIGITDWIHAEGPEAREDLAAGEHLGGFDRARGRLLRTPRNRAWLPEEEQTLAEVLRDAGYATAHVGKWHLGPLAEGHGPESQGFEVNAGGCRYGQPPSFFDPYRNDRFADIPSLPPRKEGEYLTDREADEAVAFIEAHADRPFFLHLAHYAVHSPIQARAEQVARFEGRRGRFQSHAPYAAMVASVDDAMGRVTATLERLDLLQDTLIVFTSDNGGASHFPATDNRPLRAGKGFPYEAGLRVPLILHWPGHIAAGRTDDTPVSSIDLLPTLAAALELPLSADVDGIDLLPLWQDGGSLPARSLYWHFPHYWWGTRVQPYSIVRNGDHKLIHWWQNGETELYDLATDPEEQRELGTDRAELRRALEQDLHTALAEQGARLPAPSDGSR